MSTSSPRPKKETTSTGKKSSTKPTSDPSPDLILVGEKNQPDEVETVYDGAGNIVHQTLYWNPEPRAVIGIVEMEENEQGLTINGKMNPWPPDPEMVQYFK